MNREELLYKLKNENIPSDMYYLSGGLPNEKYVMSHENGKWQVYYSERGIKTNYREFNIESDACDYMLKLLVN